MSVLVAIDNALVAVEAAVEELPRVSASKIGLDVRAGFVFVDLDDRAIIASNSNKRSLDYYGGFEYVDSDNITEIGSYKVYAEESVDGEICNRITTALDYFDQLTDEEVA